MLGAILVGAAANAVLFWALTKTDKTGPTTSMARSTGASAARQWAQ